VRLTVASTSPSNPFIVEVTAATNFCGNPWKSAMKAVIEGNHEAAKALALSVAGVMGAMLMWTLMMLLFY
jgi:ABC-type arginine transport system permease subunit